MSTMMPRLANLADRLVDGYRADPRLLGIIRILFAAHVLVFPVDYKWVSEVPAAFWQPTPGLAMLFGDAPSLTFTIGLEVVRALLAVMILIGYRVFPASIALTVVLIFGSSLTHSFGKLDHFILYEVLPLFMAFAGWGAAYSLDARARRARQSSGLPMLMWAMTVGFALFSAALPKAATGWLHPAREATRGYLALDLADPVKLGPLGEWMFSFDIPFLWKSLDYATILVEGALVFLVFVPALFRWGLVLISIFHVGVYLMMGIDFALYFFGYAVFFSPVYIWLVNRFAGIRAKPKAADPEPASVG